MYISKIKKDELFDEDFPKLIRKIKNRTNNNDDDFLMICTGVTGSGKTSLMFHGYELFSENPKIDYVCLKRPDFANSIKKVTNEKIDRFVGFDEANVNKRDALTKWNKDLIDMYLAIRGLNIFHWWNNPSIEMLDKSFVQEKVNGIIFVRDKWKDKPRRYYFFTKARLIEMFDNYGKITIEILKKFGHKYAMYQGYFKAYNGSLYQEYLALKEDRMLSKVNDFFEKYGSQGKEGRYSINQLADKMLVGKTTARRTMLKLIEEGKLFKDRDFIVTPTGTNLFEPSIISLFLANITDRKENIRKVRERKQT